MKTKEEERSTAERRCVHTPSTQDNVQFIKTDTVAIAQFHKVKTDDNVFVYVCLKSCEQHVFLQEMLGLEF